MTALGGSIADFYDDHAELYALISDDRDFARQARALADDLLGLKPGMRFLELFAGPARHSQELQRAHAVTCVAIDCSQPMRQLATGAGGLPSDSYVLSRLPLLPSVDRLGGRFDGASILRYSVGYLRPGDLLELLHGLGDLIYPGGRLVLELHDLDLVRAEFASLDIRERRVERADGTTVRCVWPAGPLRWQPDDWVVTMDVLLQRLDGTRVLAEHRFQSVERIYARAEIEALATATGRWRASACERVGDATAAFGGPLMLLERT